MLPPSPLHPVPVLPSTRSRCQYGRKAYSISPPHSFSFHKIRYEDTYPSCCKCQICCPLVRIHTSLFFLPHRPSSPLPPLPHAASFVFIISFFGYGFMPCSLHSPTRPSPEPSRKMRSIIPTVLSQRVEYPSMPHVRSDG